MYASLERSSPRAKQPSRMDLPLMKHQLAELYAAREIETSGTFPIPDGQLEMRVNLNIADRKGNLAIKPEISQVIKSRTGFLSDPPGSGKTMVIIALASKRAPELEWSHYFDDGLANVNHPIYQMTLETRTRYPKSSKATLVVVPTALFHQWESALEKSECSFSYRAFHSKKSKLEYLQTQDVPTKSGETKKVTISNHFDAETLADLASRHSLILMSTSCYTGSLDAVLSIIWNRMIIDETESVDSMRRHLPCANFLWVVSATPSNLDNCASCHYGKKSANIRKYLTVASSQQFLTHSLGKFEAEYYLILVQDSQVQKLLGNIQINSQFQAHILTGNLTDAIATLCTGDKTFANLIQVILQELTNRLNSLKLVEKVIQTTGVTNSNLVANDIGGFFNRPAINLIALSKLENCSKQQLVDNRESLVARIEGEISTIKKGGKKLLKQKKICFICGFPAKNPQIVSCCQVVFCKECLRTRMHVNQPIYRGCPSCTGILSKKIITKLVDDTDDSIQEGDLTASKLTSLLEIISCFAGQIDYRAGLKKKKSRGKKLTKEQKKDLASPKLQALIFTDFYEEKIEEYLLSCEISYARVNGTAASINKKIEQYQAGEISVILLNTTKMASGLNLECTTHVVIASRFSTEKENQIIGRALRPPRNFPLTVIFVAFEMENQKCLSKPDGDIPRNSTQLLTTVSELEEVIF